MVGTFSVSLKHSGTRILFIDFFNKETKNKICTFFSKYSDRIKNGQEKVRKSRKVSERKRIWAEKRLWSIDINQNYINRQYKN